LARSSFGSSAGNHHGVFREVLEKLGDVRDVVLLAFDSIRDVTALVAEALPPQ
jgi:hypothetical protein